MPTEIDSLLSSVDSARDEIVSLLQDVVRIPTVNSGPRPDTGNETAVCDVLRKKLEYEGVAHEVHESAPGRGNLIARLGPSGAKRLLLMSHTDVVPVEDESLWEHPPFSGTLDRGRGHPRNRARGRVDGTAQTFEIRCRADVLACGRATGHGALTVTGAELPVTPQAPVTAKPVTGGTKDRLGV